MSSKPVSAAQPAQSKTTGLIVGAIIIIVLSLATNYLANLKGMHKALEFPLWAAILGLVANIILTTTRTRDFIMPAIRTELFLKIGLILLGASVDIRQIGVVGAKGIVQALIMITCVFLFTWWLGGVFKLNEKMRAVMCTAISVCGVSAAIAAAGSVMAGKEELTYITALVIFTALPLMVLMPYLAIAMNLPVNVAGAWFGGNIDTTAAVVGAGAIHGEAAMKVASIVKMSQNALIGVVAFILALYFTTVVERRNGGTGERPSAKVIWDRFPKFVIGFVIASVLASVGLFTKAEVSAINNLRSWAFTLAFVCIGLELSFAEFKRLGFAPTVVYIIATVFNTLLALGVAWLIFGGILFPA
ncbi:MAG TPA: putative sulfate exporter family transporter [Firmicutes bacterium]|nr:putative sulfate exporter family transporter [Bacillota bacterium]